MEYRIQTGATISGALKSSAGGGGGDGHEYAWEKTYERSWEAVEEDEAGLIRTEALERARRAAQQRKQAAEASGIVQGMRVQRGMLRHVFLVLDMSRSMLATDIKPSRAVAVARAAQEFTAEFFDQNPISSLGLIVAKRGIAERAGDLSANRDRCIRLIAAHCGLVGMSATATDAALAAASAGVCEGEFSLQTCLEIAFRSLQLVPPYGSREVLVIHGSHSSVDPGNIMTTIASCKAARISVSFISLPGEVFIATKCALETGGRWAVPDGSYDSLRTHALSHCVPPPKKKRVAAAAAPGTGADGDSVSVNVNDADADDDDIELRARSVPMGFPRMLGEAGGLLTTASTNSTLNNNAQQYALVPCACHGEIRGNVASAAGTAGAGAGAASGHGYICPRCDGKLCDLPTSCNVCGLQLISAARLARSYHHLFPVPVFVEVLGVDEPAVIGRDRGEQEEEEQQEDDDDHQDGQGRAENKESEALSRRQQPLQQRGQRRRRILSADEFKRRQDKVASVVSRFLPLGASLAQAAGDDGHSAEGEHQFEEVEVEVDGDGEEEEGSSSSGGGSNDATAAKRRKTESVQDGPLSKSEGKGKGAAKTKVMRLLRLPLLVTDDSSSCCGCGIGLRPKAPRYVCLGCRSAFCNECDVLIHETLHNCPGCC